MSVSPHPTAVLAAIGMSCAVLLPAACGGPPPQPVEEPRPPAARQGPSVPPPLRIDLAPGERRESLLAPRQVHVYPVHLDAGEFARLVVDQRGVDVRLVLVGPGGGELRAMDRPIGGHGEEWVSILAETPTSFEVEVRCGSSEAGRYEARLEGPRPLLPEDRYRVEAEADYMAGWALEKLAGSEVDWLADRLAPQALKLYREALGHWERADDLQGRAVALFHLGDLLQQSGQLEEALESLERARPLLEASGEDSALAAALNDLGVLYHQGGRTSDSIAAYEQALRLARRVGDKEIERVAQENLATADLVLRRTRSALPPFLDLLEWARREEDRDEEARLLYKIGQAHLDLGDAESASPLLEQALALVRQRHSRVGEARIREALARLELLRGKPAAALPHLEGSLARLDEEALASPGRQDLDFERAVVLNTRGRALRRLERWAEARGAYAEAVGVLRRIGAERDAARVEMNLAWVLDGMGETEAALAAYRKLRTYFRRRDDPGGEASTLYGMARALVRRGDLDGAEAAVERALELVEARRGEWSGSLFAELFGATKQDYFSFYVDVLVERYHRDPRGAYDEQALRAVDRSRAWGLVIALREARFGIRRGLDPELLALRDELWDRLQGLAWSREEESPAGSVKIEMEMEETEARLELLEARIRAASPRYGELTSAPEPPPLTEIRQLLDPDTRLLVYSLGEERSWLFVVSREGLGIRELAARQVIDGAARASHGALQGSSLVTGRTIAESRLRRLAGLVLEPAAAELTAPTVRRWLIVPDGALAYVPFAALPEPGESPGAGEPVVARRETVVLPSISALTELRHMAQGRPRPPGTVAVFADAVYNPDDERLPETSEVVPPDGEALVRIPETAEEASLFERLVPPGKRLVRTGFDATVEELLAAPLGRYRFLHLAAHALVDTDQPQLSSVVLSRYGRQGAFLGGRLALHQIYDLELPVELVVLSACETALGREVPGEGLVGLTRGFMYAGAPRVLVSLWKVQDRATAELMQRFYHALLEEGLAPAAALRQAQDSLRREPGFASPHQWAGFVLQGDWL